MALETLKGVEKIGGFDVAHQCVGEMASITKDTDYIRIIHDINIISFRIQDGPIKENGVNGVNGCQVDTLIHAAKTILEGLNVKFPSSYNSNAISFLTHAIRELEARTNDREKRKVEGYSKI